MPVLHRAAGKCYPCPLGGRLDGLLACPVLHALPLRIGLCPGDSNGIDRQGICEIDDYPLRMKRVVLAREGLREIRITFPVRIQISIRQARVTTVLAAFIAGEAAMWQGISE